MSVRTVHDVAGLAVLFEDDVSVVVLQRQLDAALRREALAAMAHPSFQQLTTVVPNEKDRAKVIASLSDAPRLAEEALFWSELVCELTGCPMVGMRLARVDTPMCARFHVDRVTVRVVCTYAGAGTEFLDHAAVDRRFLGHGAAGQADEVSGLLRNSSHIQRADCGDVLLLKGEIWPNNAGRGAVHRSPMASAASPRLVMTLDPLDG